MQQIGAVISVLASATHEPDPAKWDHWGGVSLNANDGKHEYRLYIYRKTDTFWFRKDGDSEYYCCPDATAFVSLIEKLYSKSADVAQPPDPYDADDGM